jgi:branched-chain amino acid transport system substrate-binding protein
VKRSRRFTAISIAVAVAGLLAACGGDDDDAASTTTAATVTTAAASTTQGSTAPTDSSATTAAPGSSEAPTTSAAHEPISLKVGVAAPLSGPYVALGESAVKGINLAVDQLADQGVNIELVVEDTASDPQTTLNAFTKLTSQDHVDAILGTLCSSCNTAGTAVLEQAQIPQLTIGEGSTSGCEASKLVVCVVEDSESRVKRIEEAAQAAGATSVGILQSELSAPGKEVTEALQAALPDAGIDVKVAVAAADAQDYKAQLTSLGDVDMLVVAGAAGAQSGIILRNMEDLGMEQQVIGLIWSDEILSAADPGFVNDHYKFTAAFVAGAPAAADFTAAFSAANDGKAPDKYAATGYTSTMLLGQAAIDAGTTDGPALRSAIDGVKISTPLGESAITDGVWKIDARLAQYKDGQQVFVDA